MVYLYILESMDKKGYYIGITSDLEKRLSKHNKGQVFSTKNKRPFKIVYTERLNNYTEARKREIEVKSYKGGNSFKNLLDI